MSDDDRVQAVLDKLGPTPAHEADWPVSRRATLRALATLGLAGAMGSASAQSVGTVRADTAVFSNYGSVATSDGYDLTIDGTTFDLGGGELTLPDGTAVSELTMPDGSVSEIVGPDGARLANVPPVQPLAIGGDDGNAAVATVERYDGSQWQSLPDLPTAREDLAATTDGQGRPLAIGGQDSNGTVGTVERYDGSQWQSLPDLPTARQDLAATTDGQGRPLAIGGYDFGAFGTVERYDGSQWQSLPDLSTPRHKLAATTDGQGRPLAIGGIDGNFDTVGTVERYDGSAWQSLPDLPTARDKLAATAMEL